MCVRGSERENDQHRMLEKQRERERARERERKRKKMISIEWRRNKERARARECSSLRRVSSVYFEWYRQRSVIVASSSSDTCVSRGQRCNLSLC